MGPWTVVMHTVTFTVQFLNCIMHIYFTIEIMYTPTPLIHHHIENTRYSCEHSLH